MIQNCRFGWVYLFCMTGYVGLSYKIFEKIDSLPGLVVDEIFHVPQGMLYCHGNFSYYDPKITTPPGLYFLSALVLMQFNLCSTYWLRLFNFILGIISVDLVRRLLHYSEKPHHLTKLQCRLYEMISAFVICSLPPMYFFNNLYYTDTLSTVSVLCMFLAAKHNAHFTAIFFGFLSVVIRQTNVIWMNVVYGEAFLTILLQVLLTPSRAERINRTKFNFMPDFNNALRSLSYRRFPFQLIKIYEYIVCTIYVGLISTFVAFVYYNGGIVLGDKNSHKLTMHFPQLMYFSLFVLFFLFPHYIDEIKPFLRSVKEKTKWYIVVATIFVLFVIFNTQVHPYLLADNRHYTFYIWNRLLSHSAIRIGLVIVYIFAWYAIYKKLIKMTSWQYRFVFTCGIFLSVTFQKLIDVRYFFLPYLALRIHTNTYNKYILMGELLISLIVNLLTLNVYFSKEFYWTNFDYPQRIIW